MSIYERDLDNKGVYPFDVLATKSMRIYSRFRKRWEQAYVMLTYRCPRTHPAWKELNTLLLQKYPTVDSLRNGIYQILLVRNKYQELMFQPFYYEFFDLVVNMLRVMDQMGN